MKFTSVLIASLIAATPALAQAEIDISLVVYEQKERVQAVHELYLFECFGVPSAGDEPAPLRSENDPSCDRADQAYVREQGYLFFLIYGRLPSPGEDLEEMTQ
jgi:hypothetical protein